MRLLASSCFAALVAVALATAACKEPNPNNCVSTDTCNGIDAALDASIACSATVPCSPTSSTPFCMEGTCVGCVDSAACDALFEDKEVCLKDPPGAPFGECVVCDEDGRQAPDVGMATDECAVVGSQVCDGNTHTCRACAADAECTSRLCSAGACIAANDIAYVQRNGSGSGPCAATAPCPTLLLGEAANKPFILVAPDATPYMEASEIDFNMRQVTVRATGATVQFTGDMKFIEVRNPASVVTFEGGTYDGGDNGDAVFLNTGATLTLDGVTARNSASDGVRSTGRLTVRGSTIFSNGESGIEMNSIGQPLEVTRSRLIRNDGEGLRVTAAQTATVMNNFIVKNCGGNVCSAFRVDNLVTPSRMELNTIAENQSSAGTNGGGVSCQGIAVISNSIIFLNTGTSQSSGCTVRYSILGDAVAGNPDNNLSGNPSFRDVAGEDYRVMVGSPAAGHADPGTQYTGAAAVDHEGDQRPQPAASRGDVGADEIP